MTAALPHTLVTLADWETLPEDETHDVECDEGALIVLPKPAPWHQVLGSELASQLRRQLRPAFAVVPDVDVLFQAEPLTMRAPEVVVVPTSAYSLDRRRFDATEVVVAVEVLSPGTRRRDLRDKRDLYADAGIAQYWVVDRVGDFVALSVHHLDGAAYGLPDVHTATADLDVEGLAVHVDLDALLA